MSEQVIQDFLKSENSEFISYVKGNLIDEDRTVEQISIEIRNATNHQTRFGILDGGYDTHRVALTTPGNPSSDLYDVNGLIITVGALRVDETTIFLNDDFRIINKFENAGIQAMITNSLQKDQPILSDGDDGALNCKSELSIDLFRELSRQSSGCADVLRRHDPDDAVRAAGDTHRPRPNVLCFHRRCDSGSSSVDQ